MNQAVSIYVSKYSFPRERVSQSLLFIAMAWLTVACGLLGGRDDEVAQQAYVLHCNDTCRNEGQCGTVPDNTGVVLAHNSQPSTRDHNIFFPVNTQVTILRSEQRTVRRPASEEQFGLHFYEVQAVDSGLIGWVTSWCVDESN